MRGGGEFTDGASFAETTEQSQELMFRELRAFIIAIFPGPDAGPFLFFDGPQTSMMPRLCPSINGALLPFDFAEVGRIPVLLHKKPSSSFLTQ